MQVMGGLGLIIVSYFIGDMLSADVVPVRKLTVIFFILVRTV